MKKSSPEPDLESKSVRNQCVRDLPKHHLQWSRGVATCSCGNWTLWGAELDSARRSHAYHRRNKFDVECQPVGQFEVTGP